MEKKTSNLLIICHGQRFTAHFVHNFDEQCTTMQNIQRLRAVTPRFYMREGFDAEETIKCSITAVGRCKKKFRSFHLSRFFSPGGRKAVGLNWRANFTEQVSRNHLRYTMIPPHDNLRCGLERLRLRSLFIAHCFAKQRSLRNITLPLPHALLIVLASAWTASVICLQRIGRCYRFPWCLRKTIRYKIASPISSRRALW